MITGTDCILVCSLSLSFTPGVSHRQGVTCLLIILLSTAELSGKIDAFLKRAAHRHGLAANVLTVSKLFDSVAQDFFSKIQSPDHCLHSVLPEEKTSSLALRPRGHQFPRVFIGFLNVLLSTIVFVRLSSSQLCFMHLRLFLCNKDLRT